MKIIKLSAENFKRLVAVEIKPDGSTIVISGKNGAGKSSVLDTITAALCGKKALPDKPIRDGQDHAEITVETEDYIIKRTFTAKGGGSLTVTNRDNMAAKSPQAMLDKMVGAIAFDPMSFVNDMDARQQRETLLKLVGLDLSEFDKKIAEIKQQRSNINIEKKAPEADLARITVTPDLPDEEVDVAALSQDLAKWQEHNHAIQLKRDLRAAKVTSLAGTEASLTIRKKEIERLQAEVENVAQQMAKTEVSLAGTQKQIADIEAELAEVSPCDLNEITQKIANANQTNANIRLNQQAKDLKTKLEVLGNSYSTLGTDLKQIEADKAAALGKADMPVKGLSVDETGVVFEGIPLSQVNSAKQLEVGVAVSMALNPKLRVIRMNGNDLDCDSMAIISKQVEDQGYQLWLERVSDDDKCGIVIQDGMVKQVN